MACIFMGSFEVIEHEQDPKGEHGEFRIIAINFIDPEFVKIAAETEMVGINRGKVPDYDRIRMVKIDDLPVQHGHSETGGE